jgi:transposase
VDILSAYRELGSYRAAAGLCGTTPKTVRRVVERRTQLPVERPPRPKATDPLGALLAERVRATDGRISAKRLLPAARAAGYGGSARSLRRAVATAKAEWRRDRRVYRPWQATPGEHLAIDWGSEGDLHVFCAVLVWSRVRFVRFAADETQETTLALLAECFETLGGVPAVVLADRMGCLKGGVVANVVVPAPGYLAFALHYGFRPDFCEAVDPESKGVVEHLVGYAKADLVIPGAPFADLAVANTAGVAWCAEVNGAVHSETSAVPAERLTAERSLLRPLPSLRPAPAPTAIRTVDRLRTVRFGSARYSVPGAFIGTRVELSVAGGELMISARGSEIARHRLVGPGEMSLTDAHYGRAAAAPVRAIRPRTPAEIAFLSLGPVAGGGQGGGRRAGPRRAGLPASSP